MSPQSPIQLNQNFVLYSLANSMKFMFLCLNAPFAFNLFFFFFFDLINFMFGKGEVWFCMCMCIFTFSQILNIIYVWNGGRQVDLYVQSDQQPKDLRYLHYVWNERSKSCICVFVFFRYLRYNIVTLCLEREVCGLCFFTFSSASRLRSSTGQQTHLMESFYLYWTPVPAPYPILFLCSLNGWILYKAKFKSSSNLKSYCQKSFWKRSSPVQSDNSEGGQKFLIDSTRQWISWWMRAQLLLYARYLSTISCLFAKSKAICNSYPKLPQKLANKKNKIRILEKCLHKKICKRVHVRMQPILDFYALKSILWKNLLRNLIPYSILRGAKKFQN